MVSKIEKITGTIAGKELIIQTGKVARQADAAITIQCGGTVVLVTCVMSSDIKEGINFLPLTVEYREKTYAVGKIPGGFFKREGRPTDKEILTSRLIDRPIRCLFPEGMVNELQLTATVLSSDGMINPDVLALNGASFALMLSSVPFNGPVGCVRVGRVNNEFIINPTYIELDESDLNLVIAAIGNGIVMIEAGMNELSEDEIQKAIDFSSSYIDQIIKMQEEFRSKIGKEKQKLELKLIPDGLLKNIKSKALNDIQESYKLPTKEKRTQHMDNISKKLIEEFVTEDSGYTEQDIKTALNKVEGQDVRRRILEENIRFDGRKFDEIRPIECEVGLLPRTHGSGLFTRGETQSLAVTTLGTSSDEQKIDALEGESYKKFMLHYNFPSFSVGETRPVRGPGRREIGHGALAEKALSPLMPTEENFPYTVRVVSDILESNGSSSMATVCAASLALMDAGVPVKSAVSGIAMGLIKENDKEVVLTDIGGIEDHCGDMDFKAAGTRKGITVLQLDVKIEGVPFDILVKAFSQAKKAREAILDKMNEVISKPHDTISSYAPRIATVKVDSDKVGQIIGPGGRTIKKIIEKTGASIDIEDSGVVSIAADDEKALKTAVNMVSELVEDVEVGKIYTGRITRVEKFGAFCEVLPGKEGLIHVSELSQDYIKSASDVVKVQDEVKVKVIKIDELGRVNLSLKQAEVESDLKENKE